MPRLQGVRLTYLGTASVLLEYAASRLITDPTFDAEGSTYSMAPSWLPGHGFDSTKGYTSPAAPGHLDAALISHDHHFDNLDRSGRALVTSDAVDAVVTHPAAARRLGRERAAAGVAGEVTGLGAGSSTTIGRGIRITGMPARHGPRFTPQVGEVTGFLLEAADEPTVWITGDTVMTSAVRAAARVQRRVDVLVVHCGAVRFPRVPLFGRALFTFTPAEVVELCRLLEPRVIIPVHRSGWSHFQPEAELRAALEGAGFGYRTVWLQPGESAAV
jgi:L-ascorbate metabolism protein UlaG (beta-lactamase superfamily)